MNEACHIIVAEEAIVVTNFIILLIKILTDALYPGIQVADE